MKTLAADLFCGLGGWTDGLIAEDYDAVGFDIERHQYGDQKYPAQLVLQDVLTIHGSQFKDAAVIVASPPCQQYSWLAMPWSRSKSDHSKAAKALRAKWESEGPDNRLFEACFRIQREAIAATEKSCQECGGTGTDAPDEWGPGYTCDHCGGLGWTERRYIPLIVENVRGAQEWVGAVFYGLDAWMKANLQERWRMGRSAWNFGSFHLWGDVPALMPINIKSALKVPGLRFDGGGGSFQTASVEATGTKNTGGSWFNIANNTTSGHGKNPVHELVGQKVPSYSDPRRNGGKGVHLTSPRENSEGLKIGGDWFSDPNSTCHKHGSRSNARKAASAQIAKIPFALSSHIARVYKPKPYKPKPL